jgi:hypothetical protein
MQVGTLSGDSFGHHPFAQTSWIGPAQWCSVRKQADFDERCQARLMHVLALSVPSGLDWLAHLPERPRAVVSFLPWHHSGIGVLTITTACERHAVAVALDLAGRIDLRYLVQAEADGCLGIAACSDDVSPVFPLLGLTPAVCEAEGHPRLTAREFTSAIEDLRWALRTDALFPMLGIAPRESVLESLTVNVCQPL